MKKSNLEGFEIPVSVTLEAEPVESTRPKGELPARTCDSDESLDDKLAFEVTTVKKGTVEGFGLPDKDEGEFEWGTPLLGGSSDEEDYGDEDGAVFDEVSIPLERSIRRIKKPDQEVIEEYVDDEGRRVKRISKVTTTRTITRVERRTPTHELAIDLPAEPGEDVQEFIDEHGQRVRRVVRTSVTTSTKTVLRDGALKVVLTPGDSGRQELGDGPEDTERIQTFTSDHGHRTQKLSKTTAKSQLKGPTESLTVKMPHEITSLEDGQPSVDQSPDDSARAERIERKVSYPEWLVPVKEKLPTPVSISSIQIEPHLPEVPTVRDPQKPHVVEEVSASIIERNPPVISLNALEDEEVSPAVRERKRAEPPVGLPQSPEIPRKKVQKELPYDEVSKTDVLLPTPPTKRNAEEEMEVEDAKEGDEPMDEDEEEEDEEDDDEFDEEIVIVEVKRRPRVPRWFAVLPDEPEIPVEPESLSYPMKTSRSFPQTREMPEIREDLSCVNIDRKVTIPEQMESDLLSAKGDDQTPEEVEEYVDENGVRVRRIVKRTIATRSVIRTSLGAKREERQPKIFESAAPVYLEIDVEEVLPSVHTREVALPEWMVESELTPKEQEKPQEDISWLVLPSAPKQDEPKEERDREGLRESVTATFLNREIVLPEIDDMEDKSPEAIEEYVDVNGVRLTRIVKQAVSTRTIKRESQQIEPVELTFPVAQTPAELPEQVEEYVDENGVRVRRIVKRTITTRSVIRSSLDAKREEGQPKIFESAAPVYQEMDPEDVVPSVQTRDVVLPEWMVEREPTPKEQGKPREEISWLVLPFEPKQDEPKEERDREGVRESVSPTTLNREIVIPEIDGMEDKSPEAIEEYVDENGVRVRRLVKRTVTTRTIKREGQQIEPVELTFPVALRQDESPEQVEEYVDENGVRVRRIVRRTITTKAIKREGQQIEPVAVTFPVAQTPDESPEQVEEYVDENGVRVRRMVRQHRGMLDTSVIESAVPVALYRVVEEAAPTAEMATLEAITPEAVLLAHTPPSSPRRASMPYETTVVQRYLIIMETLYQYVLEHKSMIFIYSSRHMQFNFVLENFLYWMLVTLKTLSWMRPIPWKVDEIQEQLQQIKVFLSRGTCLHLHEGIDSQRC